MHVFSTLYYILCQTDMERYAVFVNPPDFLSSSPMSLVSYGKTVRLLSILDFLHILLHSGASEISFCIFGRSSYISHNRWRFWLFASFLNLFRFFLKSS